ncbi:hypothetical protein CYMTET_30272 [Cymbomonas tetramitiformis]|uniref:Uncharacterized protein n=1 Tax=Cymbomonas tetramitiformis TaxID=36881 RepID=A0AAE0KU36_9CHLO|nr:hypothetical protein CYMTET_30272 [Cymbomonas tetramitiformis]
MAATVECTPCNFRRAKKDEEHLIEAGTYWLGLGDGPYPPLQDPHAYQCLTRVSERCQVHKALVKMKEYGEEDHVEEFASPWRILSMLGPRPERQSKLENYWVWCNEIASMRLVFRETYLGVNTEYKGIRNYNGLVEKYKSFHVCSKCVRLCQNLLCRGLRSHLYALDAKDLKTF